MNFDYEGYGTILLSGTITLDLSFYYYEAIIESIYLSGSADVLSTKATPVSCERKFRCRSPFGDIECFSPQSYFPQCRNINIKCDPRASAMVAGVIVCRQRFIVPTAQTDPNPLTPKFDRIA